MTNKDDTIAVFTENMRKSLDNLSKVFSQYNKIIENIKPTILAINRILENSFKEISYASSFMNRMKEANFICWELLEKEKLIECLKQKTNEEFLMFYDDCLGEDYLNKIIENTRKVLKKLKYEKLFNQSVKAMNNGDFDLALLGITAVIDSSFDLMIKNDDYKLSKKIPLIIEKLENEEALNRDDINVVLLYSTYVKTANDFISFIKFNENEPKFLNRNWIVHGRKTLNANRIDCERLIRLLYGSFLICDYIR